MSSSDSSEDDLEDEEQYSVEKIVDQRFEPDGTLKYRVRWEGYFPEQDTWEPIENLKDCQQALKDYEIKRARNLGIRPPKCSGSRDKDAEDSRAPLEKPVKKPQTFRRISRVVTTSDSEDDKSSSAAGKAGSSSTQRKTVEADAKSKSMDLLKAKISKLQLHKKVETDDRQVKHSEKKNKLTGEISSVALRQFMPDALKTKFKKDNPLSILPTELPKKLHIPKVVRKVSNDGKKIECADSAPSSKPKKKSVASVKLSGSSKHPKSDHQLPSFKNGVKRKESSSSNVASATDSRVSKERVRAISTKLQRQSSESSSDRQASDSSGSSSRTGERPKCKSKQLTLTENESQDSEEVISRTCQRPKNKAKKLPLDETESQDSEEVFDLTLTPQHEDNQSCSRDSDESSASTIINAFVESEQSSARAEEINFEDALRAVDCGLAIPKPAPKSALKSERTNSFEDELASMDRDLTTGKPKKKRVLKPEKPDDADSRSRSPTQLMKKFRIPKVVQKMSEDNKETECILPEPTSLLEEKSAASGKFSGHSYQPRNEQQLPTFKNGVKRKDISSVSATSGTARTVEQPCFSYDVGESCSNAAASTSANDSVLASIGDDFLERMQDYELDLEFDAALRYSPKLDIDECSPQGLGQNFADFSTFGSLPAKMDDQPEDQKNVIPSPPPPPPPPPAREDVKVKMKPKIKAKLEESDEMIQLLHQHVKDGNYKEIVDWYRVPERNDWELVNQSGSTILMQAAVNARMNIVNLLVINGANVNARQASSDKTLMMIMCEYDLAVPTEKNLLQVVEMLIAAGGKINLRDPHGETALMKACRCGKTSIVRCLLDFGVDFYITTDYPRALGRRMAAVDFAKRDSKNVVRNSKNHLDTVQMLTTHEARVTAAFEAQIQLVLNNSGKLSDPLFDTTIFSLCEGTMFTLSFNYKKQEIEPDAGLLLFVAHALISVDSEIQCRLYSDVTAVSAVELNGVRLKEITQAGCVLSLHPVHEGTNELVFDTVDMTNSDIKLIVRAHKVRLID